MKKGILTFITSLTLGAPFAFGDLSCSELKYTDGASAGGSPSELVVIEKDGLPAGIQMTTHNYTSKTSVEPLVRRNDSEFETILRFDGDAQFVYDSKKHKLYFTAAMSTETMSADCE